MTFKQIEANLDEAFFKTFLMKKTYFSWTGPVTGAQEFSGPTMLQLIVNSINLTTLAGVSN